MYHTTGRDFLIVKCKGCGLIRLEPRPAPEDLGESYPQTYWYAPQESASGRLEQFYRRFVLRDHLNFVTRALRDAGEDGLVLDVGCGGGLLLRMLREQGLRGVGLDNSPRAARLAWETNGVRVVCGDLANSPLAPGSCAAVTMFHVLEHLLDPLEYLVSARALLRPNGRLIVQTPNAASWQFQILGKHWNGIDVPRHLINYRQKDLESLVEFAGFEVIRRKHFSLRDNPAGLASSVAPGLDPMARRIRAIRENGASKASKDLLYFGLVLGSLPFTLLEAACGAGSTIMLEARRK